MGTLAEVLAAKGRLRVVLPETSGNESMWIRASRSETKPATDARLQARDQLWRRVALVAVSAGPAAHHAGATRRAIVMVTKLPENPPECQGRSVAIGDQLTDEQQPELVGVITGL